MLCSMIKGVSFVLRVMIQSMCRVLVSGGSPARPLGDHWSLPGTEVTLSSWAFGPSLGLTLQGTGIWEGMRMGALYRERIGSGRTRAVGGVGDIVRVGVCVWGAVLSWCLVSSCCRCLDWCWCRWEKIYWYSI